MNTPEKDLNTVRELALKAEAAGGRAFFVGGFVRDRLLGIPNKDVDVEIHGITPEKLSEILAPFGAEISHGKSFGITSIKGTHIDIALPRKERKTGISHRDFLVEVDPFLGPEKAAARRDFTINAMMEDILTGEITDLFGGKKDLEDKVIRHVSDITFPEDPLRVLRGAQFAARFGMTVAPETLHLFSQMDLTALSRERVEEELKKALLKSRRPGVFFEVLRDAGQLDFWFPELKKLIGLPQDPVFHPEGDVWNHTMEVLERAAAFRDKVSDPYHFMMLALTHDLGKICCTELIDGRIHAYGHETLGMPLVEEFTSRISSDTSLMAYLTNMVPLHMKPNIIAFSEPGVKSTNRMFDSASSPEDLIYFSMSDKPVFSGETPFSGNSDFLFERLEIYRATMAEPFVAGKDLIDAGLRPGEYFSEVLDYAHKLRLVRTPKHSALKQVLSYVRVHFPEEYAAVKEKSST